MRIKSNLIHFKEFVTINQSLITGTHMEAAGILNFFTNPWDTLLLILFFKE